MKMIIFCTIFQFVNENIGFLRSIFIIYTNKSHIFPFFCQNLYDSIYNNHLVLKKIEIPTGLKPCQNLSFLHLQQAVPNVSNCPTIFIKSQNTL